MHAFAGVGRMSVLASGVDRQSPHLDPPHVRSSVWRIAALSQGNAVGCKNPAYGEMSLPGDVNSQLPRVVAPSARTPVQE